MRNRDRIRAIIAGEPADRCGFWLGAPVAETWPHLHQYFGTTSEEELRQKLGDGFRLICPQFFPSTYQHPEGKLLFPMTAGDGGVYHPAVGPLGHAERVEQLDEYDWPDPSYLDFEETLEVLHNAGDVYRASGFWTHFYHNLMDIFGMQQYFVKMFTHPEVVHAATERVCRFYLEANRRFFEVAGDLVDGYMFANDLGTQRDLILGPKQLDEFVLPWIRQFADLAHGRGLQVIYHSCGSVHRMINALIEAGVDCLHPLQALAANMDAETLARDFKGRIAFMGGVDVQRLLVHGSPEDVQREVKRLIGLLGPRLIVSPAHEGILPDIPPRNLQALAEAANAFGGIDSR